MDIITQYITLDFVNNNFVSVNAKQYDKDARRIIITCTDRGQQRNLSSSTQMCNVKMITPDNRPIYDIATINDDGTVTVTLTADMLACAGLGRLEIEIIDTANKKRLSTMGCNVNIEDSVYPDDAVIVSPEFSVLVEALEKVGDAQETLGNVIVLENEIKTNESARAMAESNRVTAENARISAETNRSSAETTRVASEKTRASNETARVSAEDIRKDNENTRISNENTRKTAETVRISAETDRVSAENIRVSNETARSTAETARITAETNRDNEEKNRVSAENIRIENENTRKSNETARQTAESQRQTDTATAITNAETATERANNAAEICEQLILSGGADIITTEDSMLENSFAGGIALLGIEGASEQEENQSPDNPHEIKSVGDGGSLTIKASGKNLLLPQLGGSGLNGTSGYNSGITVTLLGDGGIHYVGTATNNMNIGLRLSRTLNKGDKVYLSGIMSDGTERQCRLIDTSTSPVAYGTTCSSGYHTVNIDNADTFTTRLTKGETYDFVLYMMVSEVESSYEPYKSNQITIPLSQPLYAVDENCKDRIVFKDGRWQIERNCYAFTLDGSTTGWSKSTSTEGVFYEMYVVKDIAPSRYSHMICDSYITDSNSIAQMADKTIKCSPSAVDDVMIYIKDSSYTTVGELKAGLAANPIFCVVKRAEPIYEDIADQMPFYGLESFDTVTYISADGEVEPMVELKYGTSEVGALALKAYNEACAGGGSSSTLVGLTASVDELNYCDGVTSNIQEQLDDINNSLNNLNYIPVEHATPLSDANNATSDCLYYISSATTNGVGTDAYLQQLETFSGFKLQIARGITDNFTKTRILKVGDATWSDWRTFATTEDDLANYLPLAGGTMTGTIASQSIVPKETDKYTLGTSTNIWTQISSKSFYTRDASGIAYALLYPATVGTTSTDGMARLTLGNTTSSGTDGNAYGDILMYHKNTNYTRIMPNHTATAGVNITLPPASGTLATTSNLSSYVPLTGSTAITGALRTTSEYQTTTPNGFRIAHGNYGFFIRNDGNATYLMVTNSGDQYGNWSDARPLIINNANGIVSINGVTMDQCAKLASGNNFTGRQNCTMDIGVGTSSFSDAPIVTNATATGVTNGARAMIGFHNHSNNGAALYLDTDGQFKYVLNSGTGKILATTAHLASYLPLTGGKMTGRILMNNNEMCFGASSSSGFIRSRGAGSQLGFGAYWSGASMTMFEALLMQLLSENSMQLFPGADNTCNFGLGSYRWKNIYAGNGTIQTSDRTKKTNIADLETEKAKSFVMGLKPSTYKFIDGTSDRTHYGLVAQDVEELMESLDMSSKDFAGFIKSPRQVMVEVEGENGEMTSELQEVEGEYDYSLRYDEFIAPLIKMVQMQQAEIDTLKTEISELKNS